VNTIDGPTTLVRHEAIWGGLSIGQLSKRFTPFVALVEPEEIINVVFFPFNDVITRAHDVIKLKHANIFNMQYMSK